MTKDVDTQIGFAEQFDRLWRDKFPHIVTTLGGRLTEREVLAELDIRPFTRMEIPAAGFTLWGFKTSADADAFLRAAPLLKVS